MRSKYAKAVTDSVTDFDNETFDTGRILVVIAVIAMIFFVGYDLIVHKATFDSQSFGIGVGTLLGGLGAYVFGDRKGYVARPPSYGGHDYYRGGYSQHQQPPGGWPPPYRGGRSPSESGHQPPGNLGSQPLDGLEP